MTPIQYAIARAAKQTENAELLKYCEQFDRPPAAEPMQSVRQILNSSAGEPVTAPSPRREQFSFIDYDRRYAPSVPRPYSAIADEQRRRAKIEADWERSAVEAAEQEAAARRAARERQAPARVSRYG